MDSFGGIVKEKKAHKSELKIPKGGIEPPCPRKTTDFESVASTNSATSALQRPNIVKVPYECKF